MKVFFNEKQIKAACLISESIKVLNSYNDYRNFNNDFMIRGILSEIAVKIMIGIRPNFDVFFDKLGDNGNDLLGFDIKSIMPNHKRLVIYPNEYLKTKGYIVVSLTKDFKTCEFKGFIFSKDFKNKFISEDLGFGIRQTILLENLMNFENFLFYVKKS